jgi:GNAT superfamily N-acetyltransferase
MRRELPNGYEVDDDRGRVDVDVVHRFLAEEAYWVRGRDRATIERLVRESARVIGVYRGEELVGFARVVSDGSNMAWLGDVFVLEGHRGHGLGVELVREGRPALGPSRPRMVPQHPRCAQPVRALRLREAERANDGPPPPVLITRPGDPRGGRCRPGLGRGW